MGKILLGPQLVFRTMPVVLVGANVDGKPNFMAVAACGIANMQPPMITIALRYGRHTYKGMQQNSTFSINVPSVAQIKEADYCGLVSGSKVNKVEVCHFSVFYGKLGNAPLIEQCPVNLECKVVHILGLDTHLLIVGRVEEAHISQGCLTDGKPDIDKIKPFLYTAETEHLYRAFGEVLGKPNSIRKETGKTD